MSLSESKKTATFYTASSLLKSAINIFAGFLVLRWVSPTDMGIWQWAMIFNAYAQILNLGIPTGLNRELPFLQGAGKHSEAENLAASAQLFSILCAAFSFLTLLIIGIAMFINGSDTKTLFAIIGVGLIISTSFYNGYLVVLFRSNAAFNKLSKVYLLEAVLLIGLLPLIFLFNFLGLVAYYVIGAVFLAILTHAYRPVRVRGIFNLQQLLHLGKIGLPIFTLGYLQGISKTFPKLILLNLGGKALLGLYSPVYAIVNAMMLIPKSLTQFLYPKMNYRLGKTNDPRLLWPMITKTSIYLFVFFFVAFIPIWFLLPYAINHFFPKYIESTLACQIALLSGLINASFVGIHALNSVKAFKERLILTITYLGAAIVFPYVGTVYLSPLIGVSVGMVCADLLQRVLAYFITKKVLFREQL